MNQLQLTGPMSAPEETPLSNPFHQSTRHSWSQPEQTDPTLVLTHLKFTGCFTLVDSPSEGDITHIRYTAKHPLLIPKIQMENARHLQQDIIRNCKCPPIFHKEIFETHETAPTILEFINVPNRYPITKHTQ
jgi:hypothetical protein